MCRNVSFLAGDGHELIDLLENNYRALIHGDAHPGVTAAAISAIQEGSAFGLPTRHEIALAADLSARVPVGERWRFANSGTEAVRIAIRTARACTGRGAILRFDGAVASDVVVVPVGDADALLAALHEHGDRLAAVVFDLMPNRAGLRPASRRLPSERSPACWFLGG